MVKMTNSAMRKEREFRTVSIDTVPARSRFISRLLGGKIWEKFPQIPASSRSFLNKWPVSDILKKLNGDFDGFWREFSKVPAFILWSANGL